MKHTIELDHLWVRTPDPVAARAELEASGFVLGAHQVHRGTGTANAVYFFDNVYLELLWIDDAPSLAAPAVRRTGLLERLAPTRPDISAFGVSFRFGPAAQESAAMPVATWDWPAPFLPPGAVPIPIATNSTVFEEPLVFASLVTRRPDRRDVPRQAPLGLREVTDLQLGVSGVAALSDVLLTMGRAGVATFCISSAPRAVLTLDGGQSGRQLELTSLPLTFRF